MKKVDSAGKEYRWRPIAELHEDHGQCVVIHIEDPGYMEIRSVYDLDFEESEWTHFVEIPILTTEDAATLIAEMSNNQAET